MNEWQRFTTPQVESNITADVETTQVHLASLIKVEKTYRWEDRLTEGGPLLEI